MTAIEKYRPLLRRLAGVLVVGVVLALIGSISIPINNDAVFTDLKNAIAQDFGPVSDIEGKAELRLLPRPSVDIVGLKLSFNNHVKLEAPLVSFGLSLVALTAGRYEPVSSTLSAPHIVVPNAFVPKGPETLSKEFTTFLTNQAQKNPSTKTERLETITINDGTFAFIDNDAVQSAPSTITGTLYLLSDGARRLTASGNWRKQDVTFQAEIGAASTSGDDSRKASLFLSSALGSLKLTGTATKNNATLFSGNLSVDISHIDKVSEWLALQPPIPFSTSLKIDGMASITPLTVAVSEAQIRLGNVAMTGGVSLDLSKPRPLIAGTLSAGDMDVTNFLTPIWPKQAERVGWKNTPVDPNITPDQDLDIRLSAERINLGIVRISNAALSIIARDRTLNVTLASAHMFQGMTKGKVSIQPSPQGFSLTSHWMFETFDIGQTTLALMDMRKLEGSVSGKFDLESNGRSIDEMMKSLSGKADFSIVNGTLSGVNIATILKRIETRPLSVIRDMRGGKTDFETMHVSMRIANGTATIDDSEMLFAPNMMKLNGSVAIGERQLNLVGEATGPAPQNGAEPAVLAYTVTGSFDDPIVTPDINRILKRSGGAATLPE